MRRDAIRRLVRSRVVSTQAELGELLDKEGFEVNQSTLSRDLAALQARRTRQGTALAYEIDVLAPSGGMDSLASMHHLVISVDASDALVVVKTMPGAASIIAAAIDTSKDSQALGTLAGDDTIFIVPARGVRPNRVADDLRALWKKGSSR